MNRSFFLFFKLLCLSFEEDCNKASGVAMSPKTCDGSLTRFYFSCFSFVEGVTAIPASKPAAHSHSLTSMLLNQSSVKNPIVNNVAPSQSTTTSTPVNNAEQSEENHISKLDIRVGIVRSVAAHPDAESLYIEQGQ